MRLIDELSLPEVVAAVNHYQVRRVMHPFTCGNCPEPVRSERPLVAELEGDRVVLVCPNGCGWRQVMLFDAQLEAAVQMSRLAKQPWEY